MTPTVLKVSSPGAVSTPRGALWAADAAVHLIQLGEAAWRWLAGPGAAAEAPRSADALQRLASAVQREQPSLAWEVRAIARHLRTFESAPAQGHVTPGGPR